MWTCYLFDWPKVESVDKINIKKYFIYTLYLGNFYFCLAVTNEVSREDRILVSVY